MNLTKVINNVLRIIGDTNQVTVKAEDIVDWANESILTIVRETECITATDTSDYGPTTQGHALPTQFIGEKRVTWDSIPLDHTDITSLDNTGLVPPDTAGGTPSHYYFHAGMIWLYPQPATTKSLALYYVQAPSRLDDLNTELPLPIHLHNTVTRMTLIRARELNEDFDVAAKLQSEVDQNLGKDRDDIQNRQRETFPVVKDDPNDWSW